MPATLFYPFLLTIHPFTLQSSSISWSRDECLPIFPAAGVRCLVSRFHAGHGSKQCTGRELFRIDVRAIVDDLYDLRVLLILGASYA